MIDLLPPPVKEHKRYGQLNHKLINYGFGIVLTAVLIGVIFGGSYLWLKQNEATTDAKLTEAVSKNAEYSSIEQDAKILADRLSSIEDVQAQQTHYTNLLNELSAVTPKGVYIVSLNVVSEGGSGMRISAFAESDAAVAAFQSSIESSPRFAAAALQSEDDDADPYSGKPAKRISLTVGLEPGAFK